MTVRKGYDGFDGTENFDYVLPRNESVLEGVRGGYQIELTPMGTTQHGKYVVWYQDRFGSLKYFELATVKTNEDAHTVIEAHEAFLTVVHELELKALTPLRGIQQ